jgi:hypothetical protein
MIGTLICLGVAVAALVVYYAKKEKVAPAVVVETAVADATKAIDSVEEKIKS